jgi:hypothetical protein
LSTHFTEIVIGLGPGGGVVEHLVGNEAVALAVLVTPPTLTLQTRVEPASAVPVTADSTVPGLNVVGCPRSAGPGENELPPPTGTVTAVEFGFE